MTMRWLALAALPGLAFGAWILYEKTGDPVSSDARERIELIKAGLDREIGAGLLCVRAGPFPFDVRADFIGCERCEDLEAAGLVERHAAEGSSEENPHWIYDLTDQAEGVYSAEDDPVTGNKGPRFCFGHARVHHLVAAQPALHMGGTMFIGVEYVLEAVDPHPLLFDPQIEPLGLEVPAGEGAKLFKPVVTTLRFTPDGKQYLESDSGFRYGSWINR
jgi:hypothetical protein